MEDKISLKCLFCKSLNFEVADNYIPKLGDQIKCANCGKTNDYGSMFKVAEEDILKIAQGILKSWNFD